MVGARAERIRLWRITIITADEQAPAGLRAVFACVLSEECFHERALRSLTGKEALHAARDGHARGMTALGLWL